MRDFHMIRILFPLLACNGLVALPGCAGEDTPDLDVQRSALSLESEDAPVGWQLCSTIDCGGDPREEVCGTFETYGGAGTRAHLLFGDLAPGVCSITTLLRDAHGNKLEDCLPAEAEAVIEAGRTTVVRLLNVCSADEPGQLILIGQVCFLARVGSPAPEPGLWLQPGETSVVGFTPEDAFHQGVPSPLRLELQVVEPAQAGLVRIEPLDDRQFAVTCLQPGPAAQEWQIDLRVRLHQCGVALDRQQLPIFCYPAPVCQGEVVEGFPWVAAGGTSYGYDVTRDAQGFIWLLTDLQDAGRIELRRYAPDGALAAGFPVELPDARAYYGGLAADEQGGVWVAGADIASGLLRAALWHVDALGGLQAGSPRVLGDGATESLALGVARDAGGGIWASGFVMTRPGDHDLAVWKLDAQGQPVAGFPWIVSLGGGHENGFEIVIGQDGSVWVGGTSGTTTYTIWKFHPQGGLAAGFPLFAPCAGEPELMGSLQDLAVDAAGRIWTTGSPGWGDSTTVVVSALNPDGSCAFPPLYWDDPEHGIDRGYAIALDAQDHAWVGGFQTDPDTLLLFRVTPEGQLAADFPKRVPDGRGLGGVAVGLDGSVWVSGDRNERAAIWKLE